MKRERERKGEGEKGRCTGTETFYSLEPEKQDRETRTLSEPESQSDTGRGTVSVHRLLGLFIGLGQNRSRRHGRPGTPPGTQDGKSSKLEARRIIASNGNVWKKTSLSPFWPLSFWPSLGHFGGQERFWVARTTLERERFWVARTILGHENDSGVARTILCHENDCARENDSGLSREPEAPEAVRFQGRKITWTDHIPWLLRLAQWTQAARMIQFFALPSLSLAVVTRQASIHGV